MEDLVSKAATLSDHDLRRQWAFWKNRRVGVHRPAHEALKAEMKKRKFVLNPLNPSDKVE